MAIVLPRGYDIPEEAAAVHGITTERAIEEGEYIEDIILEFDRALQKCDRLVAHNMAFDDRVMRCEFHRYDEPTCMDTIQKLCTMRASTNMCAIPAPYGKGAFKWPKLSELHIKLFGEDFEGAHDALADIEATARCYWKLRDLYLIS
jgi:DNA polymerase III epsilon subunit-like protein